MLKSLSIIFAALFALPVSAASLIVQWNDPTPVGPEYVGYYYAEYQVIKDGVVTSRTTLKNTAPNVSATIPAVAGDVVQVRYKASNIVIPSYPVSGAWSEWYTASPVRTPENQTAPIFTVIAY